VRRGLLVILFIAQLAGCAALPPAVPVAQLPEAARTNPGRYLVVTVRDEAEEPPKAASSSRSYDGGAGYLPGASARRAAQGLARDHGLKPVSGWVIGALGVHCLVYELAPGAELAATLAALGKDARVETAEPLASFAGEGARYNDPYRPMQRYLDTLSVEDAYALSTGRGIKVAVIDTGLDLHHVDLPGARIRWRNFVDGDQAAFRSDRHGTEIAGVIAATANNGVGISGIAPDVMLYAFKACWYAPGAARAQCNSYTLAQALAAAIEARVQIVNLSLSGPMDPLLARLVSVAIARGAIVVGAVPGDGAGGRFPASLPGVIAVARSDAAAAPGVLRAPGTDILTLEPGDHYDFASGNSLATAEVSGMLALLWARRPDAMPAALGHWLAASGGAGTVNVCAAFAASGAGRCASGGTGGTSGARAP
jgi:subtilisin family serine protease